MVSSGFIWLLTKAIKYGINLVFSWGWDLGYVLKKLGITWLSLEEGTLLDAHDGYLSLFFTPKFLLEDDNLEESMNTVMENVFAL